jgi:hypothetical protein
MEKNRIITKGMEMYGLCGAGLEPVGISLCKGQIPQAEAYAT